MTKEERIEEVRNIIDKQAKEQYMTSGSFVATPFGLDGIPFVRRDAIAEFALEYADQQTTQLKAEKEQEARNYNKLFLEMGQQIDALRSENDRLREALRELVELKNIKDKCETDPPSNENYDLYKDYLRRKPLAWETARKLVNQ